jgi:hypothetical protein
VKQHDLRQARLLGLKALDGLVERQQVLSRQFDRCPLCAPASTRLPRIPR